MKVLLWYICNAKLPYARGINYFTIERQVEHFCEGCRVHTFTTPITDIVCAQQQIRRTALMKVDFPTPLCPLIRVILSWSTFLPGQALHRFEHSARLLYTLYRYIFSLFKKLQFFFAVYVCLIKYNYRINMISLGCHEKPVDKAPATFSDLLALNSKTWSRLDAIICRSFPGEAKISRYNFYDRLRR